MTFREWMNAWKMDYPGKKLSPEQVDRIFGRMCELLQAEYDRTDSGQSGYMPGHLTADSFEMEGDIPVRFTSVTKGISKYCPNEDGSDPTRQTDMFAMGLILYELLTLQRFADQMGYDPDGDFDYIRDSYEEEGFSYVRIPSALSDQADLFDWVMKYLTAFEWNDRIWDMNDLPDCEYAWRAVNVETGREIRREEQRPVIVEFGDKEDPEQTFTAGGNQYRLAEDRTFSYSFIKNRPVIDILYQQEENPADWIDGDIGLLVREPDGRLCFAALLPGGQTSSELRLEVTRERVDGFENMTACVYQRKKMCPAQTDVEQDPSAFRHLRDDQIPLPSAGTDWKSIEIGLERGEDDSILLRWDLFDGAWNLLGSSNDETSSSKGENFFAKEMLLSDN